GISYRIIDKNENIAVYSGALIHQARTMEILDQLGLAEKAIKSGVIVNKINIIFRGKKISTIEAKNIGQGLSKFPFWLMLEQSKTEHLLCDYLSSNEIQVERKKELTKISDDNQIVTSHIKNEEGQIEKIESRFLVGADGGNSAVRKLININFTGKNFPLPLFVLDSKARVDFNSDEISFCLSDKTLAGFFPLSNGRWRIDSEIPQEIQEQASFGKISKNFADSIRIDIEFYNAEWFTVFHVREKHAEVFHKKNCFIIGDAAHVFSPIGAQGMNTGIQDAFNLAWKLSMYIQGKGKQKLVDSYSVERMAIAKKISSFTSKIFYVMTTKKRAARFLRLHIIPKLIILLSPLTKTKFIRRVIFETMSEISLNYRKSPLSVNTNRRKYKGPQPGDRMPYLIFRDENGIETNLHDKIDFTRFQLFIFSRNNTSLDELKVAEKYKDIISVEKIPFHAGTESIYKNLGIQKKEYFLVRPDMHLSWRNDKPETAELEKFLKNFFT
ncbi:MAG: FAD-dependent monooxygenase, partial [bacterium]